MNGDNGFNYFLKKEERKSLQPKKPRKRLTSFLIILGDILFILLVYTLVFKPAMEKFDKQEEILQKQFEINNIVFTYNIYSRKNDILIDFFAKNKSSNSITITKEEFYLQIISSKTPIVVKPLFDKVIIPQNESKHIPFFIEKNKLSEQFYFRVFYKDKNIKESDTFEINKLNKK